MFFMTSLFRDKSSIVFLWKMNIITFAQIYGGFLIIVNKFLYYLLLQVFRCRIEQKSI